MGIISSIINKFRFKKQTKLDTVKVLSTGEYKDGSLALLKKGKIIEKDLKWVSTNLLEGGKGAESSDLILAESMNGEFKIFDKTGFKEIDNLEDCKDPFYTITKEDGMYIVDFENGKFIVSPDKKFISEYYSFIDDADIDGKRKVTKLDAYDCKTESYYMTKGFEKCSPDFLDELAMGDYKVLTITGKDDRSRDVICDSEYNVISKELEVVDYDNGHFFDETLIGKYLIDIKGNRVSKSILWYSAFNNGNILVREQGLKEAKLYNKNLDIIALVNNPISDSEAGIVAGEMGGRFVMFGYDHNKLYPANEHVAKLLIEKLQGKKLASQYVTYIFDKEIEMGETMSSYEAVVKDNLGVDPLNDTLQVLDKSARKNFVRALETVSKDRVRRANKRLKDIEAKKIALLKQEGKATNRRAVATKLNKVVGNPSANDEEDEKI